MVSGASDTDTNRAARSVNTRGNALSYGRRWRPVFEATHRGGSRPPRLKGIRRDGRVAKLAASFTSGNSWCSRAIRVASASERKPLSNPHAHRTRTPRRVCQRAAGCRGRRGSPCPFRNRTPRSAFMTTEFALKLLVAPPETARRTWQIWSHGSGRMGTAMAGVMSGSDRAIAPRSRLIVRASVIPQVGASPHIGQDPSRSRRQRIRSGRRQRLPRVTTGRSPGRRT